MVPRQLVVKEDELGVVGYFSYVGSDVTKACSSIAEVSMLILKA